MEADSVSAKALILSKNDPHHPLETLGERLMLWLADADVVVATETHDHADLEELADVDLCIVCATLDKLTREEEASVVGFVAAGGKLIAVHSAAVIHPDREAFIDLIGGRFTHHSPYHEFAVDLVAPEHGVVAGVEPFRIRDELYVLDRAPHGADVLATARWQGADQPLVYTRRHGEGAVLYIALGHGQAAYDHASFQRLMLQGIDWVLSA